MPLAAAWSVTALTLLLKCYCTRKEKWIVHLLVAESHPHREWISHYFPYESSCTSSLVYWLSYSKPLYRTHHPLRYLNTLLSDMINICHKFHPQPLPKEWVFEVCFFFLCFSCCAFILHKGLVAWEVRASSGIRPILLSPQSTSPPVTLSIAYSPGRSDSHTFPARHLLFSCSQILHLDSAISCAALVIAQDTHFCSGLCLLSFFFF